MDREAWRAAIRGVAKSRTRLSDLTELNHWKRNLLSTHCVLSAKLSPKMALVGRVKNKYGEFPGGPMVGI